MERRSFAAGVLALLSIALLTACGGENPTGPSSPPALDSPPPPPNQDPSLLAGVWNVSVRLTGVTGSGCVAETMRSQIGAPSPYSLSITSTSVTLKSASGDRACTYPPKMDNAEFTTYNQAGYYSCEQFYLDFTCSDGTHHKIFTLGEDIGGRVSGAEISGTWDATWFDGWGDYVGIETKAQFTGSRQQSIRRSGTNP